MIELIESAESEIDDCAARGNPVDAFTLAEVFEALALASRLRGRAIKARLAGTIVDAVRLESESEAAVRRAREFVEVDE